MSLSKRLVGGVALVVALTIPAFSFAQTTTMEAEVSSLLTQIRALQAQIAQMVGVSTVPIYTQPAPPFTTPASCVNITRNLTPRMKDATTGGDVSNLQTYLIANGYLKGTPTGYYGTLTTTAVGKLQISLGLVTSFADPAYGYTGPRTRTAISCSVPQKRTITVTTPNGGEQWRVGELNTITWQPYQYNPDINPAMDVSVYLESRVGETYTTVGRVMDQGKASLHTYFNLDSYDKFAQPGQYYVRAVNNRTGAWDRSDASFTLLPRLVDVKVNGSDGPVTLATDQQVTVTWSSSGTSCWIAGLRSTPATTDLNLLNLSANGSRTAYYTGFGNIVFNCQTSTGEQNDLVAVNPPTTASLKVMTPNGGENILLGKPYDINFDLFGLKNISIALYKNDAWQNWIVENMFVGDSQARKMGYVWNVPNEASLNSSVYKIYMTGQKADGTGFVDDKSDAPFSFAASTIPIASMTVVYKTSTLPPLPSGTESAAKSMCSIFKTYVNGVWVDAECRWGGKPITSTGFNNGSLQFIKPVTNQNETISIGGTYAFTITDSSNGTGVVPAGKYVVYLEKFNVVGTQSTPERFYQANIQSIEQSGSSIYLKWDFTTDGTTQQIPAGTYYIFVANTQTGDWTTVSANTYLVNESLTDVRIEASPANVTSGGRSTITWSAPVGSACTYASPTNSSSDLAFGSVAPTGSTGVGPLTSDSTYTIACNGRTLPVTVKVTPADGTTATIQGYKVLSSDTTASSVPADIANQQVSVIGVFSGNTNPYSYTVNAGQTHTVTVAEMSGYAIGYTLCYDNIACHGQTPIAGSSVNVNMPADSGHYADLWWHYTPRTY